MREETGNMVKKAEEEKGRKKIQDIMLALSRQRGILGVASHQPVYPSQELALNVFSKI